ncbi:diadenylate cyclase CdaA [Agathobaculum butyriciproducens]|jgi:diadenylate cyclase|uniref:diadenylate cyclase CdaA n=2 Tax=Butyricicoccaceae TaxID=3085642 RepID=UPI000E477FE3|nr:diadenylate cyclase CdaA [Agathobaculum butyriciproducens]RHS82079.1 TIGR00159 family protein [Butyricicoccus sp. AM42-5AC]RHT48896.1 TIGR00159 family protein [Butyricicoccus sp. AM29-23AC]RHV43930.1 TIGR00159 family protein [Butyricicoccus sp. OM04-18BH]
MSTFHTLFSQDIGRLNWRTVLDSFFSAFNQFRTISFIDILDILIVAYIIYRVMKLLKDTSAERLIKGIIILVGIMLLASMLHLTMISWLLQQALNVGLFAIVVVFQPELRRLLEQIGKGNFSRLIVPADAPDEVESMITATVSACADMSRTKTGALIVFERRERLGEIISTGTMVDAAPSAELIKNIFFKNSPLHDGAMIVRAGRVCAAGCVLPLSGNQSLSRDLGTRHRAAVGMSESADSVLVVVSEETGSISVAIGGMLKRHLSPDMLRKLLENELLDSEKQEKSRLAAIRDMWKGGAGK